MAPQAGWYQDPSNPEFGLRYWDGTRWTEATKAAPGLQRLGANVQAFGNKTAKIGASTTILVLSIFFVVLIIVILI